MTAGFVSATQAAETGFLLSANAYGTQVKVGNVVKSGPTAKSGCGNACGTTQVPAHGQNSVLMVTDAPLLSTGVISTWSDVQQLNGSLQASSVADAHDINLLGGLVLADEVTAESTTTHDTLGFHSSANGSSLIGAIVAGNIIAVTPAPNTRINLAGIGYVVLNEQIAKHTATSSSLTVNQIHVVVTAANVVINNIKIALGTNIIVSHAVSGLTSGVQGTLDGSAYGTRARIGNLLASGPSAQISLGCLGTKGVLKQNEILQVQVPNVFAVGDVVDTAQGSISASVAIGETTSTVQAVDVLAGLVTADLVKADAHSMKNGGVYSFSDSGSKFVNLAVKGFANIDANVAPNTKLTIAGLGTLWLHRVIHSQNRIEVRMIELIVTQNNNLGLAIGTDIQVGRAEASAH